MSKTLPTHRVHVILSVQQYNALAAKARTTKVPMGQVIRDLIDATLVAKAKG